MPLRPTFLWEFFGDKNGLDSAFLFPARFGVGVLGHEEGVAFGEYVTLGFMQAGTRQITCAEIPRNDLEFVQEEGQEYLIVERSTLENHSTLYSI